MYKRLQPCPYDPFDTEAVLKWLGRLIEHKRLVVTLLSIVLTAQRCWVTQIQLSAYPEWQSFCITHLPIPPTQQPQPASYY